MEVHVFRIFKEEVSGAKGVGIIGRTDRTDTEMGLQKIEITLTVYVADNRMSKAMPRKCHEDFSSTFPPHHIVLWTPACDGRE
jgi:hypothetical protein